MNVYILVGENNLNWGIYGNGSLYLLNPVLGLDLVWTWSGPGWSWDELSLFVDYKN
jgi:hypothetical protein